MDSNLLRLKQNVDEPALVARGRADPTALAELYDLYFPLIYKYVLYRVIDAQVADDLVSQVFERMLTDLARYQPGQAPFGAWLFGITRHVVGDFYRSQKRNRMFSLDKIINLPSNDTTPDELFLKNELGDHLFRSLEKLADRERDLIGLKFGGGLTNRQISKLTQLSETNVGVILYRAMKRLQIELEKEEVNHD